MLGAYLHLYSCSGASGKLLGSLHHPAHGLVHDHHRAVPAPLAMLTPGFHCFLGTCSDMLCMLRRHSTTHSAPQASCRLLETAEVLDKLHVQKADRVYPQRQGHVVASSEATLVEPTSSAEHACAQMIVSV